MKTFIKLAIIFLIVLLLFSSYLAITNRMDGGHFHHLPTESQTLVRQIDRALKELEDQGYPLASVIPIVIKVCDQVTGFPDYQLAINYPDIQGSFYAKHLSMPRELSLIQVHRVAISSPKFLPSLVMEGMVIGKMDHHIILHLELPAQTLTNYEDYINFKALILDILENSPLKLSPL